MKQFAMMEQNQMMMNQKALKRILHLEPDAFYHKGELPDDFFTNPKYSCNDSNRLI